MCQTKSSLDLLLEGHASQTILQVLRVLKNLKFDSNLLPISRCFKGEKVTETLRKVQIQLGEYKKYLIKHTGLNFKGTKWVKDDNGILNLQIKTSESIEFDLFGFAHQEVQSDVSAFELTSPTIDVPLSKIPTSLTSFRTNSSLNPNTIVLFEISTALFKFNKEAIPFTLDNQENNGSTRVLLEKLFQLERSCLFIKYHGYFQNEDDFKDGCYFGLSSAGLKEENAELDKSGIN